MGEPVAVNDSSWSIPALNGFPGGYMKDVAGWFSPDNFLSLMSSHEDKRTVLNEVVVYYDGDNEQVFTFRRFGKFINSPKGSYRPSISRVVTMDGDDGTISQVFNKHKNSMSEIISSDRYKHWDDFAKWFSSKREL